MLHCPALSWYLSYTSQSKLGVQAEGCQMDEQAKAIALLSQPSFHLHARFDPVPQPLGVAQASLLALTRHDLDRPSVHSLSHAVIGLVQMKSRAMCAATMVASDACYSQTNP